MPAGFVVTRDEPLVPMALAHLVDELGGFPCLVTGAATYPARSVDELVRRIADGRVDGAEVLVQRPFSVDLAGHATSLFPGLDDDAGVVEVVAGSGDATQPSRLFLRLVDGEVTSRELANAVANLSSRQCVQLAEWLVRLQAEAQSPIEIDFATNEAGDVVLLDCRPHSGVAPLAAGWAETELPPGPFYASLLDIPLASAVAPLQWSPPPSTRAALRQTIWHQAGWAQVVRLQREPGPDPSPFQRRLLLRPLRLDLHARLLALNDSNSAVEAWLNAATALLQLGLSEGEQHAFEAVAILLRAIRSLHAPVPATIPAPAPLSTPWTSRFGLSARPNAEADLAALRDLLQAKSTALSSFLDECRRKLDNDHTLHRLPELVAHQQGTPLDPKILAYRQQRRAGFSPPRPNAPSTTPAETPSPPPESS